ncbi:MAG TPA: lysophospholipid acyltransferase family protein [Steroidobacteraceae bacterium]|nr:lysophospholipid acyltransferase family protein [Steroidobacteraceae bacterium]
MLDRGWRWLATGFVVAMFGIGAVIVSLTVFPVLRLGSRNAEAARLRIQLGMHRTFRLYVWGMKSLGLLTYEVHDVERLWLPGQLVIANHPSLLDVVFLVSLMPRVDCIVKQGLWHNPFLRWPVAWASYIPNLSGETLVQECAATLRRGNSLLVFPEGTRSYPGRPLLMQRGAAHVALESEAPILPVTIQVSEPTLTKGYPWYRVPRRRPHFCIKVGEPWPPSVYNPGGQKGALAARRLTGLFGAYYAAAAGPGTVHSEGAGASGRAINDDEDTRRSSRAPARDAGGPVRD